MDALDAIWTDDESVAVDGRGPARTKRTQRTFSMDGSTKPGAADRFHVVLALGDRAVVTESRGGRRPARSRLDGTCAGDATSTVNVPCDQRDAVGATNEHCRNRGSGWCHDRSLTTVTGVPTEDRSGC